MRTTPMIWADRRHDDKERCVCCGKPLKGQVAWVEVINGGNDVAHPDEKPDQNDPGYMGLHPVGVTCARKHFKGFTQ